MKTVYQTWKYKELPKEIQACRDAMIQRNPNYTFILFDDKEMDDWMTRHTDERTYSAFKALAVGAAKADLWRYCIIYQNGGIYLDIDSTIHVPIDDMILPTDEALISRERASGCFNQWLFACKKHHPVLRLTIDFAVENIEKRSSNDIAQLTGPGPFTKAINTYYIEHLPKYIPLWYQRDDEINPYTDSTAVEHRARFFGRDFNGVAAWKSDGADSLYTVQPHWQSVSIIYTA